jgi:integrase
MTRSPQQVQVFGIQDRRRSGKVHPWIVRWRVEGRSQSRAFRTRAEADRYRSLLMQAVTAGESFDLRACLPSSWVERGEAQEVSLFGWVRQWLAEQWPEWQPRTRRSAVEAMTRFLPLVVVVGAPPAPVDLRRYLTGALPPGGDLTADAACERWVSEHGLTLNDLTKPILAAVDVALGTGDDGQLLGSRTATRRRTVARACIRRAVQLDLLAADPWPPAPKGRAARKVNRHRRGVDVHSLPDPPTMVEILDAMASHQPGSLLYQQMTAIVYYAGLRPSEVVMLRRRSIVLPDEGLWGRIDVTEADIDFDVPGEPKTGARSVPIPPVLVEQLRSWLSEYAPAADDLLFRTRSHSRPSGSNWSRSWRRALERTGHSGWRVYDCRHAAATTWLASGAPLGEVARRLGHTVDTLVTTYVGALTGDETITNDRIGAVLAEARPPRPAALRRGAA